MSKILLLGGTGALGTYLVEELVPQGHDIYITSRSSHNNTKDVNYIVGNARDIRFLQDILRTRWDCIVDFMIWPSEVFRDVYKNLLNSCGHYIFTSSYRVYANAGRVPLTEDKPLLLDTTTDQEYLKTDEYALAKARSEKILFNSDCENFTIIRPAITFSKFRFQIGTHEAGTILPCSLAQRPLLLPEEMLRKECAVSWAGDVAKMIKPLLLNIDAYRNIFNVANAERHTWGEIASYYHEIIGTKLKFTDLDTYIKVMGGQYQIKYDRMFDRVIDNTKVLKFSWLKNSDLTPIRKALEFELKDYKTKLAQIKPNNNLIYKMKQVCMEQKSVHSPESKNQTKAISNGPSLKVVPKKEKVGLLNFHFANNYGAVLVPFALKRVIESLGFEVEIINYVAQKFSRQGEFLKFRGKYLNPVSREYSNIEELKTDAENWNKIVVGSDQVWRMFDTNVYMLEWAKGQCSFIAYAASFGHDCYEGSIPKSKACSLLHRFDAISVREDSGVDICKNDFGVPAVQVLDPTFLLSSTTYEKIINREKINIPNEPYICGVFLSAKSANYVNNPNILLSLRSKYKLINAIKGESNNFRSVAEWLGIIKNAKYVITDSFHGTVFSIIFNKQFITLMHEGFNGNARIPSLLKSLGIGMDRIADDVNKITLDSFNSQIDYGKVNKILQIKRNESFSFLKKALLAGCREKSDFKEPDSFEVMSKINLLNLKQNNPSITQEEGKWLQLKLAEIIENTNSTSKLHLQKQQRPNYTKMQFCIYWTYRFLFRISFGSLKKFFKAKRAYYRDIVRGPIV